MARTHLRRWISVGLAAAGPLALGGLARDVRADGDVAYSASAELAYGAIAQAPASAEAPGRRTASTAPLMPAPVGAGAPVGARSLSGDTGFNDEWDPIEPFNRGLFAFNDAADVYVIEPAARGWKAITPQAMRSSVARFFSNLRFPVRFFGCLAQGRLVDTGEEAARFVVNTTVGIAGLFDPAARIGLRLHDEDLGQGIGSWGVGPGPYLVLPFLGPYTVRDVVDIPLESAGSLVPGLNAVNLVNTRAGLLAEVREAKAASLDYYSFVRNAYLQRRRALILNETQVPQETGDDLYEIGDEK